MTMRHWIDEIGIVSPKPLYADFGASASAVAQDRPAPLSYNRRQSQTRRTERNSPEQAHAQCPAPG